jgi:hypothetical protein
MPDKYNFSKHLSGIVRPVLHPLGFRKKGSRFLQIEDDCMYSIVVSRS